MSFSPIAIVGQAAVLPGAPSASALWDVVSEGRDCIGPAPEGRWRVDPAKVLGSGPDRTWSDRGGYVRGFEPRFAEELASDPFLMPSDRLLGLDPLFQLVLHTGRAALRDAGHSGDGRRVGAIFGNLSYPSAGLSAYAEAVWFGRQRPDAMNRFMSGMPAHLLAASLGLGGPAFALDAACASSLYAMGLACDALHDGRADVMLAGAVNRCDDLFIHTGFCALKAMSTTGRSRPFHAEADGLVPAEGAGFVVLKRLEDAERAGDRVLGVIRGVGLSNDGRGKSFLAPAVEGQVRAMRAAWERAGLDPRTASLVECHATGTSVGDATELRSMREVFGDTPIPIGSLKSNLGHLITAAGVAGTLKVLASMAHGVRPQTLHADVPNPELGAFRLLHANEPWVCEGPKRAAVSAFGFGGNNAHVVLEEPGAVRATPVARPLRMEPVAVVALGARVGAGEDAADFAHDLTSTGSKGPSGDIGISLKGLRFPPRDIEQSRAQQVLLLAAAREAVDPLDLPRERTMVLVGMGCDPEVCRYGARWRLADQLQGPALEQARDAVIDVLEAPGVIGNMPNIPANRLNSQFDLAGPSFTVSAEELSGGEALDIARRALAVGDIDAAVVGAVDLSHEPVHIAASAAIGAPRPPGDAAVVLVLERLADARRLGHPVLAVLDAPSGAQVWGPGGVDLVPLFGHAHAASGLVHLAGAVLSGQPADVLTRSLTGREHRIGVQPGSDALPARRPLEAPVKTFPAHPAPIVPPTPAPRAEVPMQTMEPAPSLPPTSFDGPTAANPQVMPEVRAAAVPEAPVMTAPSVPRLSQIPLQSGPAGILVAAQQHLGEVHRAYLAQQQALHEHFLATRAAAMATLAQARGGAAVPRPVLPAAPVMTRPAPVAAPVAPVRPPAPVIEPPVAPKPAVKAETPSPRKPSGARQRPDDGSATLPGPRFSRQDLEHLASFRISDRFGPLFGVQDDFPRQVRMPEEPFLLCDRVTGLDAEPASMTTGTIWTETDVVADGWYMHQGHMPAGIMIEAGQADLLLISWLGADFENRGERVYRLLGCELTYHGGLPCIGDLLKFDIHVDGHAKLGAQRMFFFHSDCRIDGEVRLSVREGQAGFFSDAELANSGGVLWDAKTGEHDASARLDAPVVPLAKGTFTKDEIDAFAEGHPVACFGEGFAVTEAHTRTPRIPHGNLQVLERITHLDHRGGPWGRGYLRAEDDITPDDWFFQGHFKDDPCMPGTFMFEVCLSTMAFYLTSMGFTLNRDGWTFRPVQDVPYSLKCRGQCTPSSQRIVYEVFVEEVHDGPIPTLWADVLCTVDGLKAFYARRVGLELVPGWPLDESHPLLDGYVEPKPVARMEDGFPFDYRSLLACAWGKPSEAFGAPYTVFDHVKKVARLPGPPYHFLSRVTNVSAPFGGFAPGVKISVEYDIPHDAWYFWENAHPTMPFAVLLEAALQPCGWLASYVGSALTTDEELFFRNLDGTGTLHVELLPTSGTLRTDVEITNISNAGGMIIEGFTVTCWIGDVRVYDLKTVFGFFPGVALANQLGLPPNAAQKAAVLEKNTLVDLRARPAKYFEGPLALPEPMLLMCDRIVGWWPEGGEKGLGRIIGEKDVNPREWFFAAHFFQDPVQPGSLGIENMLQVIMWAAIEKGLHEGMAAPHFEPILLSRPHVWKYRGQVVPKNSVIRAEVEITGEGEDERGRFLFGHCYLWADGLRIYEAFDLGIRVVDGPPAGTIADRPDTTDRDIGRSYLPAVSRRSRSTSEVLDPAAEPWLADHCPTWTVPALPAMSMVDRLFGVSGATRLEDVTVLRWLALPGPVEVRAEADGDEARLSAWRTADRPELSRFEPVCTARIADPTPAPEPWEPVIGVVVDDPYASGHLFHGPAFQLLTELVRCDEGSSVRLDTARSGVPKGTTHQALLDAMTHGIPHDEMGIWFDAIGDDQVAYPHKLAWIEVWGPAPTGECRAEVRPLPSRDPRHPSVAFQIVDGDRVWAAGELTEVTLPKGPLGSADPAQRRVFLRDRAWVYQLGLSSFSGETASLRASTVHASDWLPGTVASAYDLRGEDRLHEIAVKDLVAQLACVHPSEVDASVPCVKTTPLTRWPVEVTALTGRVDVKATGNPDLDIGSVKAWWDRWFGVGRWPVEDLYYGLIEAFVGQVHVEDPAAFEAIHGRSTLYLGNHQVAVESLLFSILASGLSGVPTVTLAKIEHQHTWLGRLIAHCFTWPGVKDPGVITFFDRDDKESLPRIIGELAKEMMGPGKSVMVHIEGTRSLECRTPVQKMSSAFIDMALKTNSPIVPVRFTDALPAEPLDTRIEFPVGLGRQDIWLGRPILPETLAAMAYKDRKQVVIDAINALGMSNADEQPTAPNPELQAAAEAWRAAHPATDDEHAVLAAVLQGLASRCEETDMALHGAATTPWAMELQRRLFEGL
ncbi:MAG: polyketide synthase dehydratase domain-containing protein [Alphaproteobacteria bacterium]|nr:polyketide synthase dehydratase domain-containing protein [Alphaproteobacteria bacterium]